MKKELLVQYNLNEFPTHVAKTANKIAENKYVKINNQSIYSGALNKFGRAIAVNNLHEYIISELNKQFIPTRPLSEKLYIVFTIKTVLNHGNISRRKGVYYWKPPTKHYKPNWDIENLASLWIKVINDSLTLANVILDDNIAVVKGIAYQFEECETLEERNINIKIYRKE